MKFFTVNKTEKAYKKIKNLQKWLNKHFPDILPMEPMDDYKFIEAEDLLSEEARRWHHSKTNKN